MTNTNEKKVVITKAMKFADIQALLRGEKVSHGTTIESAVEFIQKEIDLLAKKNTSKKSDADIEADNKRADRILDYLLDQSEGKTCTEIVQGATPELSSPKVTSLLKVLQEKGLVRRDVVKGKSLFFAIRGAVIDNGETETGENE